MPVLFELAAEHIPVPDFKWASKNQEICQFLKGAIIWASKLHQNNIDSYLSV